MNAYETPTRMVGIVLGLVTIELTLTTAYIHLTLGGAIFMLNGLGYMALAAGVLASTLPLQLVRRLRWVPRIGLAGYALVTVGAYLVIGPYFLLGWITKAIEVAIIGIVVADLMNSYRRPAGAGRLAVSPCGRHVPTTSWSRAGRQAQRPGPPPRPAAKLAQRRLHPRPPGWQAPTTGTSCPSRARP